MEHRVGKCTDCQASFKVPATFEANKAKCKKCGGVVEIGPIVSDAPAAPANTPEEAAKPKPVPVPARKPAPKPVAKKAPARKAPAAAKPKAAAKKPAEAGPSMKDRLLAERKADSGSKASGSKTSGSKASGSKARTSGKPSSSRATGAGRKAGAGAGKARAGASARGAKAKTERGEARPARRGAAAEKKSPAPMLAGGVLLLVAGFAVWQFVLKDDPDQAQASSGTADTVADAGDAANTSVSDETTGTQDSTDAVDKTDTPATDDGASATTDDAGTGEGSTGSGAGDGSDATTDGSAAGDEATSEPAKAKPKKVVDVSSVDLSELDDFGAYSESSDEDWGEIRRLVNVLLDPDAGAAGNRARKALTNDYSKAAIPGILNQMKRLDLGSDQGRKDGDIAQRTLMDICNGRNIGWKYTIEPADVLFNKKVVKKWFEVWELAKDNETYWLQFSKQENAEPEDKPAEEGPAEDELDDLDDLDY
ncbi:MAG: hypothetical protein ACI841_003019 [Planctomycetota bacterium]|jgi:hypothetical protein